MSFFQYNKKIINLKHVSHFTCTDGTLEAHLNQPQDNENRNTILLGNLTNEDEGLRVAQEIIYGKYSLPKSATPETATSEPQSPLEQTKDDPVTKQKVIENARELFKLQQTKIIAEELGIDTLKIYGEAQSLWGESENWNTEIWQQYLEAIAHFHQRKGVLYDKLKPNYTEKTTNKGPF